MKTTTTKAPSSRVPDVPRLDPEPTGPIRNTPMTLDELDAIDWAIHCVRHLVAAAHCTDESEDEVVDSCMLPEILGGIERHIDTIEQALKAADARREQKVGV